MNKIPLTYLKIILLFSTFSILQSCIMFKNKNAETPSLQYKGYYISEKAGLVDRVITEALKFSRDNKVSLKKIYTNDFDTICERLRNNHQPEGLLYDYTVVGNSITFMIFIQETYGVKFYLQYKGILLDKAHLELKVNIINSQNLTAESNDAYAHNTRVYRYIKP